MCTNFPGINIQNKKFSRSHVITKIKHTKFKQKNITSMSSEAGGDVCVCGYHIYEDIWNAMVGKVLVCEKEPNNSQDRYAIAVTMNFPHV